MNTTNHPRRGETFEGAPCIRCGSTIRYTAKKHRCVACHDVHNHSPEHGAILKTYQKEYVKRPEVKARRRERAARLKDENAPKEIATSHWRF